MATIDTASPTVATRPQNPPVGTDQTIAGELDLSQTPAWSFLSSFAFPAPDHFPFTYNDGDVTLDIGAGRVARQTDAGQTILTVDPVTGLNLKGGTVNYIYFTGSDTVESKDSDVPPGPNSLLIGTVDPRDGTINVETRGRSPVSQFQTDSGPVAGGASDESRTAVDGKDLADGEIAYHREFVPDGFVLRLNLFGVMDDTVTETAGLAARVVDANDGTVYASTESKRESLADPDKVFGPVDLRLEVRNDTGGAVTGASGRFKYDVVSGDPPGLAVDTLEATNITSDSVDLTGDLRSLGQAATADVRHEYREVGASTFTQTAIDTLSSPQEFTDAVSGLSSGTDYEFRALAAGSDGSSDQGALVTFTTAGGFTRTAVAESDLTLWYPMYEGAGSTVYDESGNNLDTDVFDTPSWTSTAKTDGGALDFDGADDYIAVATDPAIEITADHSVCAWVRPASLPSNTGKSISVTSKSDGSNYIAYYIDTAGTTDKIFAGFFDGDWYRAKSSKTISKDTWLHIGYSYDASGGEIRLFWNGSEEATANAPTSAPSGSGGLSVGRYEFNNSRYWNGQIDDFRLYNAELSEQQFSDIYNNTK